MNIPGFPISLCNHSTSRGWGITVEEDRASRQPPPHTLQTSSRHPPDIPSQGCGLSLLSERPSRDTEVKAVRPELWRLVPAEGQTEGLWAPRVCKCCRSCLRVCTASSHLPSSTWDLLPPLAPTEVSLFFNRKKTPYLILRSGYCFLRLQGWNWNSTNFKIVLHFFTIQRELKKTKHTA